MSPDTVIWEPLEDPAWEGMVKLSDGYERFVQRFGAGAETLVCLHGGPGANLRSFYPLTTLAGDGLQVVLYDQLGGGRSDRPEHDDLFTVERFVAEFVELVDVLDLGRVHLLGQSWGGMLTQQCGLDCPQLLKSLTICNTAASVRAALVGYEQILATVPPLLRERVATVPFGDDSPAGRALLELYATHVRRSDPFDLERSCAEFLEYVVPMIGEIGRPYEAMWGPNEFVPTGPLRDWDVTARLGEIETPALVVCGIHDEVVPACSLEIAALLPNAQSLLLGQSSHMVFHEADAQVLLGAVRAFAMRNGERR